MVNVARNPIFPRATFAYNQDRDLIVRTQPGRLATKFAQRKTLAQENVGAGNSQRLVNRSLKGFRFLVFGDKTHGTIFETSAQRFNVPIHGTHDQNRNSGELCRQLRQYLVSEVVIAVAKLDVEQDEIGFGLIV